VDVLFLGAKRGVHNDRVAGLGFFVCYGDIRIDKFHIGTEEPGVLLCDPDRILVNLDTPDCAGTEQGSANGEDAGPAPEIADRFSLNVALHEGIVEEPGGKRRRCLVLFEPGPRFCIPRTPLERYLKLPEFHGISSMA